MAFTRSQANEILAKIKEPALTDREFKTMTVSNEIYSELSKVIQNLRGGAGAAFHKLKRTAYENGITLEKKVWSNVFIGGVVE